MLPPPTPSSRLRRALRSTRRALLRRRRLLAAGLLAVAVVAGLRAVAEPPPATVTVAVAATDLPAGALLDPSDLASVELPPDAVPDAVVEQPAGRALAAPLRAGEPVTDVRLVGPAVTEGLDDVVALPLRLPDGGAVALLQPGDRVDLLATDPRGASAEHVARSVPVLALPADDGGTSAQGLPGRLVVVGVDPADVAEVTASGVASVLTFTWSDG